MLNLQTADDYFAYLDFARDHLLRLSAPLNDDALRRPFAIGLGSLLETIRHLYLAERVWYQRWAPTEFSGLPAPESLGSIAQLADAFQSGSGARANWLRGLPPDALSRDVSYTTSRGESFSHPLGELILHVCTHGAHHRAQALNMLRQLGVRVPWLDYLARALEQGAAACALPDPATVQALFAYGDWANASVLDAMQPLSAADLDRAFPMGLGSLRRTMIHIRDAEQWWLANWGDGPRTQFPAPDESLGVESLRARFRQTAADRDAHLSSLTPADLARIVTASPRPGVVREVPLGLSLNQLCYHGVHHRAQALNMLRHVGAQPPTIDYIAWIRRGT